MNKEKDEAPIVLKAIARVKNDVHELGRHDWSQVLSELLFYPDYEDALDGIGEFSHIIVLFWMHRSPVWEHSMSRTHPRRRLDLPLVGVFATCSPVRPNQLGLTVVKLLERSHNTLRVRGLDAVDGTRVVDVKPYFPPEPTADIRVPEWVRNLSRAETEK